MELRLLTVQPADKLLYPSALLSTQELHNVLNNGNIELILTILFFKKILKKKKK